MMTMARMSLGMVMVVGLVTTCGEHDGLVQYLTHGQGDSHDGPIMKQYPALNIFS